MLGENIKSARESKGMTQQELADKLHVVDKQYQNGKRTYPFLMQIY